MKLDKKSVFDKATLVTLYDNKIYAGDAFYELSALKLPEDLDNGHVPGIIIYFNTGLDGVWRTFWVEDDDVYPFYRLDDSYGILMDFEYEEFKDQMKPEDREEIDRCFEYLNKTIIEGGLVG